MFVKNLKGKYIFVWRFYVPHIFKTPLYKYSKLPVGDWEETGEYIINLVWFGHFWTIYEHRLKKAGA